MVNESAFILFLQCLLWHSIKREKMPKPVIRQQKELCEINFCIMEKLNRVK